MTNFSDTLISQILTDENFKYKNSKYISHIYNACVFIAKDIVLITTLENEHVIDNIVGIE